ncbi:MAG: hypothetical protein ACLP7Q_08930 [Isosphaeraceae bacterium]
MASATWHARSQRQRKARSRAELSLAVQAREAFWLQQVREGKATKEIARREGLSRRRVQQGISWATLRERESRLGKSSAQDVTHRTLRERSSEASPKTGKGAAVRSPLEDPRYPPRLVPLFPIGPLTPQSTCPHHGPIRPGSIFCCMVCSQSGMDDHPALKRDSSTDPPPEPKPPQPTAPSSGGGETRKERRRRMQEGRRAALLRAGLGLLRTETLPQCKGRGE